MAKIDSTPSTIATNALQSIPFGSIIGAPLSACIEAQSKAAETTWKFIQEVGLENDETGGKRAVYVQFQYRRGGRLITLSVPLLTIVPIPYLSIRDVHIGFKASISASASTSTSVQKTTEFGFSTKAKAGFNFGLFSGSMEMSASVSSKKDSKATADSKYSVEYTLDVDVTAGQDDMPAGLAKVLELLNESVDTVDAKGELVASEHAVRLVDGEGTSYVSYKNSDGLYEPASVKICQYDEKTGNPGAEIAAEKCKLLTDDTGVLCTFKEAGTYAATAGERKIVIVVR